MVYANPAYIETLSKSTPISEHVFVDFELRGCPISKQQLVEVLSAFLCGRKPNLPPNSTCLECKLKGNVCVMVAQGIPCLGPVTHAGCGAICPSYNRGCYGCFGPKETSNTRSLATWFSGNGTHSSTGTGTAPALSEKEIMRLFRSFNAYAEDFRRESETHDH
jgi:coenzyme F420-reducing hydrogenase gamma subunit